MSARGSERIIQAWELRILRSSRSRSSVGLLARVGETDSPLLASYFVFCLKPIIERVSVAGSASFVKVVRVKANFVL
jgi:hypothetical protein